jgi:hypothetical protein
LHEELEGSKNTKNKMVFSCPSCLRAFVRAEGITVEACMREAMARRKMAPAPQQAAREDKK